MLPIDDRRWNLLTTFFEDPEHLKGVLEDWLQSIGSPQEDTIYLNDLYDLFIHQVSITNVSFAVVPWLVNICKQGITKLSIMYLADVAMVEAIRLKVGLHWTRQGTDPYPEWLMSDYHQAINEARVLAEDAIAVDHEMAIKHGLVALKPALFGDAALAWSRWSSISDEAG
jgi:hypothetical protein